MTLLYTAIIILIVCVLICFSTFTDEDNKDTAMRMIKELSIICMILISIFFIIFSTLKPTARGVYQDKTTLVITYKNGVPVDSVVVLKGGEK